MAKAHSAEDVLQFMPFFEGSDALTAKVGKGRFPFYQLALVVLDFLMVAVAMALSLWVSGTNPFLLFNSPRWISFVIMVLAVVAFFPTYHLYSYHFIFSGRNHLLNITKALCWGAITIGIIFLLYTSPHVLSSFALLMVFFVALGLLFISRFFWGQVLYFIKAVGTGFLAFGMLGFLGLQETPPIMEQWPTVSLGFALSVCLVLMSRSFMVHVVFNNWMRRRFRKQVAIVGSNQESQSLTAHIIDQNAPFWVAGFVEAQADERRETPFSKARLGKLRELPSIVAERDIDEIVVTDERIDKHILISLLDYCTSKGITVWFSPKLMPIIDLKLYIDVFCGIKMIRLCSQKSCYIFNKAKHGLDALIVLPLLAVLLPLFLIIGVAIKLTSPGPVFYRAKAVGKNGRSFSMYKFRSMRQDTGNETHKAYVTKLIKGELEEESCKNGVYKMTDDDRITPVGKWLRKLSLDELPQLINVLKGDMSLVGPRPCLPYEYEAYKNWHKKRLSVRPGITGVWQVAGRSAVPFEEMVLLDLYYIYNRNIMLDLNILYETMFVVMGKEGAY